MPDDQLCYLVGSNGIFKHVKNEFYSCNVKAEKIKHLLEVKETAFITLPSLPFDMLKRVESFFKAAYVKYKSEAVVILYANPNKQEPTEAWTVKVPHQEVTAGHVRYELKDLPTEFDGYRIFGTIHSHSSMPAFHSGTDDTDEMKFDGLHITIGNVDASLSYSARWIFCGRVFTCKLADWIAQNPSLEADPSWMAMITEPAYTGYKYNNSNDYAYKGAKYYQTHSWDPTSGGYKETNYKGDEYYKTHHWDNILEEYVENEGGSGRPNYDDSDSWFQRNRGYRRRHFDGVNKTGEKETNKQDTSGVGVKAEKVGADGQGNNEQGKLAFAGTDSVIKQVEQTNKTEGTIIEGVGHADGGGVGSSTSTGGGTGKDGSSEIIGSKDGQPASGSKSECVTDKLDSSPAVVGANTAAGSSTSILKAEPVDNNKTRSIGAVVAPESEKDIDELEDNFCEELGVEDLAYFVSTAYSLDDLFDILDAVSDSKLIDLKAHLTKQFSKAEITQNEYNYTMDAIAEYEDDCINRSLLEEEIKVD